MRGPKATPIALTARQRGVLEQIIRRATSPQYAVLRAKLILAAAAGQSNQQIAQPLALNRLTVRIWRRRWASAAPRLAAVEATEAPEALARQIREVLADAPRRGAPVKFSPEQVCQIVALACEAPAASDRPVTHWTPTELAAEAVKRGIVARISPRSVGRFLKAGGPQAPSVALLAQS